MPRSKNSVVTQLRAKLKELGLTKESGAEIYHDRLSKLRPDGTPYRYLRVKIHGHIVEMGIFADFAEKLVGKENVRAYQPRWQIFQTPRKGSYGVSVTIR